MTSTETPKISQTEAVTHPPECVYTPIGPFDGYSGVVAHHSGPPPIWINAACPVHGHKAATLPVGGEAERVIAKLETSNRMYDGTTMEGMATGTHIQARRDAADLIRRLAAPSTGQEGGEGLGSSAAPIPIEGHGVAVVATLTTLLDNLVIAQGLSKEIRQHATDEARSYLYGLRHRAAPPAGQELREKVVEIINRIVDTDYGGELYYVEEAADEILSALQSREGG